MIILIQRNALGVVVNHSLFDSIEDAMADLTTLRELAEHNIVEGDIALYELGARIA